MKPDPRRAELFQALYTCPYKDRKNLNPPRVEGTCEWFTSHRLFQEWLRSDTASLLWVSADPGCGKSVLSRYLVDKFLPSAGGMTICYFFFKDGLEDQVSSTGALCCILRQIFQQRPATLSHEVLKMFKEGGETLLESFRELWDIFVTVALSYQGGDLVCVMDALDECAGSGRDQLIDSINHFYSQTPSESSRLKILLTSRPYMDIKRGFYHLESERPAIHLS